MEKESELGEISLPESGNRQSKFVYFNIVLVPILVYIVSILCYFVIIIFMHWWITDAGLRNLLKASE